MEVFDIPNIDGYSITKCGNVYSKKQNRFIKSNVNNCGYSSIVLSVNKKQKTKLIHRLIATTFLGVPDSDDMVVNHKNGNKLDNSIENLEWCTHRDNALHYKLYLKKYDKGDFSNSNSAIGLSDANPISDPIKKSRFTIEEYQEAYRLCENKTPVRFIHRKFPNISFNHIKSVYNFINGKKKHFKQI